MNAHGKGIKIFSGNSNKPLAKTIAERLGLELGKCTVGKFSDGETSIDIDEAVRGSDVFLVQSTSRPVNDHLVELLILIDAMKRASAGRITAVIPYFGYARQDRKAKRRDPISAKLVANMIACAGADRVLSMDLHTAQIEGFFDMPVDHLTGAPILANYFLKTYENMENFVVVSPDVGGVARARKFAQKLNASPLAIIDKRRQAANECEIMNIIGDVKGKKCILIDDIIDTAGTICKGADLLMERGADVVYACCTHGVFSGNAINNIKASAIEELIVLDTINLNIDKSSKIKMLSSAPYFAWAIERISEDLSLNQYNDNDWHDDIFIL